MWRETVRCSGLHRSGRCKLSFSCTTMRAGQLSSANRRYRWCFCTADALLPLEAAADPTAEQIYQETQVSGSSSTANSSIRQAVAAIEATQHIPALSSGVSRLWPVQNTSQLHRQQHQQQHQHQLALPSLQHVQQQQHLALPSSQHFNQQQQQWLGSEQQQSPALHPSPGRWEPPLDCEMPLSAEHLSFRQPAGAVHYPPIGRREGFKQATRMVKQLCSGRHVLLTGGTGLQQVRGIAALATARSLLLSGNSSRGLVFQPSFSRRQQQQQQLEPSSAGGSDKQSSSSRGSSRGSRRDKDPALMYFVTSVPEQQLRRFDQHPLCASGRGSSSRLASAVFARLCSQGYTSVRAAGADAIRVALLAAAEARRKLTHFSLDLAVVPAVQYEELADEAGSSSQDWQQHQQYQQPHLFAEGYGYPADMVVGDAADPVVRVTVLHFVRCEPRRPWALLPWRVPVEQMPSVQQLKQQQQQLGKKVQQQEAQHQLLELKQWHRQAQQQQQQQQQGQTQQPVEEMPQLIAGTGSSSSSPPAAEVDDDAEGDTSLMLLQSAAGDRPGTNTCSDDQVHNSGEGDSYDISSNPSSDSSHCNVVHVQEDDLLMFPAQGAAGGRGPGPVLLHKQHKSRRQLVAAAHSTAC